MPVLRSLQFHLGPARGDGYELDDNEVAPAPLFPSRPSMLHGDGVGACAAGVRRVGEGLLVRCGTEVCDQVRCMRSSFTTPFKIRWFDMTHRVRQDAPKGFPGSWDNMVSGAVQTRAPMAVLRERTDTLRSQERGRLITLHYMHDLRDFVDAESRIYNSEQQLDCQR